MGTDALGFDIQCNQNSGSSCSLSSMYVGHVLVLFMALVLVRLLVLFVTLIKLTFVFCGLFYLLVVCMAVVLIVIVVTMMVVVNF